MYPHQEEYYPFSPEEYRRFVLTTAEGILKACHHKSGIVLPDDSITERDLQEKQFEDNVMQLVEKNS